MSETFGGEHWCGEFPGAGGHMLGNEINITYKTEDDATNSAFPKQGWYWFNLKEGNGNNGGGPFASSWQAFHDAHQFYPEMKNCDAYARYVAERMQRAITVPTRAGRRRVK